MTLEELQAEFPHGSRWLMIADVPMVTRIVGWDPGSPFYPIAAADIEDGSVDMYEPAAFKKLFLDPVPCPITEPTTLHAHHRDAQNRNRITGWMTGVPSDFYGSEAIIVHPAEPGAAEGRYTWEQPS